MTDHDPLVERLGELGRQPVDPATASAHLTAMASAGGRRQFFGTRSKVGAAFFAGLLVGGTGLASAGALPGGAQNVAHTTLSQVGVEVPDGHGPTRSTEGCGGVVYKNHGQFVKAHKADPNAGESPCGKPVQAGKDGIEGPGTPEAPEAPEAPDSTPGASPGESHGKGHGNGRGRNKGQGTADEGPGAPATPRAPAPAGPLTPNPAPSTTTSTSAIPPPTTSPSTSTTSTTKPPATTTTIKP